MKLPLGYTLKKFDEVDCVMAQARRLAQAGAEEGTLVLAERQLHGRGREGKRWLSGPGDLHAALILRPEFSRHQSLELIPVALLALGTAVAEQVSPMTELHFRWPNALLISRGRAAGLFVDLPPAADSSEPPAWMVLGFSVNMLRHPAALALEAAALASDGDCTPQREPLLEGFARHFLAGINRWAEAGLEPFRRQWLGRAGGVGAPVTLQLAGATVNGALQDLDASGALLLENENGECHRVTLAEYFSDAV